MAGTDDISEEKLSYKDAIFIAATSLGSTRKAKAWFCSPSEEGESDIPILLFRNGSDSKLCQLLQRLEDTETIGLDARTMR